MPNLIANLLPHLTAYRIPGVAGSGDSIHPGYGGQSISNLPATICEMLDVHWPREPLSEKWREVIGGPYRQIILLLVDGLVCNSLKILFMNHPGHWMEEGNLLPLTTIVPSTTSAALTSLWTGKTPVEHGILGYNSG
jgi:predicted AlkP superfamily pyrophosphatase or phosphodiesterase